MNYLDYLAFSHHHGMQQGLPSVCSAHPLVIEAALRHGLGRQQPVLIEATCNQVNQFGGYTGQTPADFAHFVAEMAERIGLSRQRLLLGGDHLGPLPWASEPAESAMKKAADLVRAFVQAGFVKIHLDCSMPLGGEPAPSLETIAERTAFLAAVAERAAEGTGRHTPIRYIVGSEVPPAGGAGSGQATLQVTRPEAAAETFAAMQHAFVRNGLQEAWERVRALVVQPGVEFGDETVHRYDEKSAVGLVRWIESVPDLVYEAHSTDYQPVSALRALVRDHFAILKVGPELTFSLRRAVFALEAIERELYPAEACSHLSEALEQAMQAQPTYWQKYYTGEEREKRLKRRFSLSDRIRYYWSDPGVQRAFEHLWNNLVRVRLSLALVQQHFPHLVSLDSSVPLSPTELIYREVASVLDRYWQASLPGPGA
jgi:D-tagatose-1,6-bisphosphate aldolase subunit GatZ/KbaZ